MMQNKAFFILFIFCLPNIIFAQSRKVIDKNLIVQQEFYIPELKCIQGKKLIESFLLRNEGIVDISTNISTKTTKVSFIKGLTNSEEIAVIISNTGYANDSTKANIDARKILPICCLDTFTDADVKGYYEIEKDKFRKAKKRYREPKKFICCKACDIVAKYRNLKK